MYSIDQFDVLNILGSSNLSATYKVRHKTSKEIFVLKGISLSNFSDQDKKYLVKKITERKEIRHPNVLEFHGVVEENIILYNIEEYCHFGNLQYFIEKECIAKQRRITESLLCKILYQTSLSFKTLDMLCGQLTTKNIFLDEEFNIKLYNFYTDIKSFKQKESKMSDLGTILLELATLKKYEKSTYGKDLQDLTYSNNFLSLLIHLLKDHKDLRNNVNKILCHPTVLLKTSQWSKENCFLDATPPLKNLVNYEEVFEINNLNIDNEKLRKKEANLQMNEEKLRNWERKLEQKEKKLSVMEQKVKEKLQQAELQLKRSREVRSISSCSSKSSTKSSCHSTKKMSYDDDLNDSLYVSCGDSIIESTSAKLNVEKIEKPKNFIRTMSERKIRFKTSPLKENKFSRKSNFRPSIKGSKIIEENKENLVPEQKSKSRLLQKNNFYENEFPKPIYHPGFLERKQQHDGKKIGWTEESKKYAFELLRMMNSNNSEEKSDKDQKEVQHTYL